MTQTTQQPDLDERQGHLWRLAEVALRPHGLQDAALTFISDTDNTVFRVDAGRSGGPSERGTFALRICNPAKYDAETIQAELDWLAALRSDTGVVVPGPVRTRDGRLLQNPYVDGLLEARYCVLFEWVEGEFRDAKLTPAMLGQVGTMMAVLHQHAEAYVRLHAVHRHRETWHDLHIWTRGRDDVDHIYTPDELTLFGKAAEQALARIGALGEERDYGLVHADLHQYNYLYYGQDVRAIDFDDCHFAPFAYDIAVTLWYLVGRAQFEAMREAFLGGYERVRPLPEGLEAQLATFTLARQLSMMQWVLSWPSPTLLPWGPRFLKSAPTTVQYYLDRL